MLFVTGEHALRAMVYLARNSESSPIPSPRIAEASGVPRKSLSSILADRIRTGLLQGTRDKSGGFQTTRTAKAVSLAEVVAPFEPITANRKSCLFGNKTCSDKDRRAAHDRWKEVDAVLTRFFGETTLQDVAARASDGSKNRRRPTVSVLRESLSRIFSAATVGVSPREPRTSVCADLCRR